MPQTDTRAQSETLGTILMIAVITASITFAGGAVTVNYLVVSQSPLEFSSN